MRIDDLTCFDGLLPLPVVVLLAGWTARGPQERAPSTSPRVVALDGLRGLAALSVVCAHAFGALQRSPLADRLLHLPPLAVLVNGIGAVQLFFVLSGYCLSISMQRGPRAGRLAQFYIRRLFRIHPPYVFGLLTAWAASFFYLGTITHPGLTLWISHFGTVHLDGSQLLRAIAFPGSAYGQMPVGWTIYIEMVYSLLLPLLMWIAARTHWGVLVIVSVAPYLLGGSLASPAFYLLHFSLGIALHAEHRRIAAAFALMPAVARTGVLVLGLTLLTVPRVLDRDFTKDGLALFAVGATLLVSCAIHFGRFSEFLSYRPIAFLGRVAYSLYLLHFTVLLLCVRLVREPLSGLLTAAFVVLVATLSCAGAALGYHYVELVAVRVGNRICAWLAHRTGVAVHASRIASAD